MIAPEDARRAGEALSEVVAMIDAHEIDATVRQRDFIAKAASDLGTGSQTPEV